MKILLAIMMVISFSITAFSQKESSSDNMGHRIALSVGTGHSRDTASSTQSLDMQLFPKHRAFGWGDYTKGFELGGGSTQHIALGLSGPDPSHLTEKYGYNLTETGKTGYAFGGGVGINLFKLGMFRPFIGFGAGEFSMTSYLVKGEVTPATGFTNLTDQGFVSARNLIIPGSVRIETSTLIGMGKFGVNIFPVKHVFFTPAYSVVSGKGVQAKQFVFSGGAIF